MNIGDRIRIKREEMGLSQDELANKMGYKSRSSINKIENGTNDILQSKVIAFAKILNTSVAYLMGWEEHNQNNQYKINIKKKQLIDNYEKLNDKGKEKLIEYSDDLVSSKKYIKDEYVTVVKAARNKDKQHSIEKVQMKEEELSIFDTAPQSDEDL